MIESFIERASYFQSPSELGALYNEHCASISKEDLFNRPENQVLREGWTAVMLGLGFERGTRTNVHVRVCGREQFPDFRIKYGGHDLAFEATEAMLDAPGSKPGVVYRGDISLGPIRSGRRVETPPFDYGPVKAAIKRKASKHYALPVHLCVYITYGGKGIVFDQVVRSVAEAGGDKFQSVWILTNTHMTCAKKWATIGGPDGWVDLPVEPIEEEP